MRITKSKKHRLKTNEGFTLIELLVVIGIIAILAAVVIIAINPARQFAAARNAQRRSNVETYANAIVQNMADNNGVFTCSAGAVPTTTTVIGTDGYDIEACILPIYVTVLPLDPSTGTSTDTGYSILRSPATERITITADDTELGETISVTK